MEPTAHDEFQTQTGDPSRSALTPPEFDCAGCGYSLAGMPIRKCPECGHPITDEDMESCIRRSAVRQLLPRAVSSVRRAAAGVVATVFALALATTLNPVTAATVALVAGGLIGGSWLLGWAISSGARPHDRVAARLAWIQVLLWFNGPWLLAPPAAAVIIVIHWIASFIPEGAGRWPVLLAGVVFAGGAWFILGLACSSSGSSRHNDLRVQYGVRDGSWVGGITLLILVTYFASLGFGLVLLVGGTLGILSSGLFD